MTAAAEGAPASAAPAADTESSNGEAVGVVRARPLTLPLALTCIDHRIPSNERPCADIVCIPAGEPRGGVGLRREVPVEALIKVP